MGFFCCIVSCNNGEQSVYVELDMASGVDPEAVMVAAATVRFLCYTVLYITPTNPHMFILSATVIKTAESAPGVNDFHKITCPSYHAM